MSSPGRIVVAMSGGVDSSVAAALLIEAGYDVIGLSMQLYDQGQSDHRFGTCCTIDDLQDARRVAQVLHIPHYIVNLEQAFEETVVANFVREYAAGRTPIPCTHCNRELKFATLVDRARGLQAGTVATGHYARIVTDDQGLHHLLRGVDPTKDQGYFLFGLAQAQLACAQFPVGALHKSDVRRMAESRGLPVADKPDSQEICFVPDGDYASFVERRLPGRPGGLMIDLEGRVVGRHEGVHRFTIGQRKGLGLATGAPLFVVALDAERRVVTVGPRSALERRELVASDVNWIAGVPPSPGTPIAAQIRHRNPAGAASVKMDDSGRAHVVFDHPQTAITPGQAVVFYQDDEVLGGGWIE